MLIDLTIIGAGGHSKVVTDVLVNNNMNNFSIVDSSPSKLGTVIQGNNVSLFDNTTKIKSFHIAIGDNQSRAELYDRTEFEGEFVSIISIQAYIADTAKIGKGAFIAANSVVSAESSLAKGCIVNHGAIIEHDCRVGAFCHIAPNATLLGGVTLGQRVFVGAGATVLPGVRIVADVIIGAGAVVLSDILESGVVVGTPARKI